MTELQSLEPQLLSGLDGCRRWFHGMIDSETGRLCYKFIPDKKEFLKEPSPGGGCALESFDPTFALCLSWP